MSTMAPVLEKPAAGRRPPVGTNPLPVAALQRKYACGATTMNAPKIVDEVLESPGSALDPGTRGFMESRFNRDFGEVRVHTDSKAAESARAVKASAYTVGRDVVFGAGQVAPSKRAGRMLLAHELTHVVQQRAARNPIPHTLLEVGPANDSLELEAERFARQIAGVNGTDSVPPPNPAGDSKPRLQRAPADQAAATTAPAVAAPEGLIVEDDVPELAPGQMHKTEFLDRLRTEVCATSDAALVPAGRTSKGCPLIEKWINQMRGRSSRHVERAIRKYAPESAGATTAKDYIAPVGSRVQRGVQKWAASGEVSDVPAELIAEMAGGGVLGVLAGVGSAISGALGSVGRIFAKAQPGGVREGNPAAIQARLNSAPSARPLESGIRTRMESAFGHSFSQVRVHADSSAAQLSSSLNARAFTVGGDVAFAAGEYRPGTLIGDALIAHELAHVVQQDGAGEAASPMGGEASLEEDADVSAVGAMLSLWGGARAVGAAVMPALRSGLKLQRCSGCSYDERNSVYKIQPCCTDGMLKELRGLRSSGQPKVQRAHDLLVASPPNLAKQLQRHFLVDAGDAGNVKQIADHLQLMSTAMAAGDARAQFYCRDSKDQGACPRTGNIGRLAAADNCSDKPVKNIFFCGDYEHGPFLKGRDWEQTMVHEYAHVACPAGGAILAAGSEFYQGVPGRPYPGPDAPTAIANADSYANFVMDVASGVAAGASGAAAGFAAMTPWQISQLSDSQFAAPSDPTAQATVAAYKRTRDLARAAFQEQGVTFDIDADTATPVGREPTEAEMKLLQTQLANILKTPGVQKAIELPGGRAAPVGGNPTPPSLAGKVRMANTAGEFGLKRYQLQMAISGPADAGSTLVKATLARYWKKYNLQPADRGTDQESRVAVFLFFAENPNVPGFYNPLEDRFYLGPFSDLNRPGDLTTARHEALHFLGAREKTRKQFLARYQADYIRHWCIFEEGTAELLSREAGKSAETKPAAAATATAPKNDETTVTVVPPYEDEVNFMQNEVIAKLGKDGRDIVLRAFFTGDIPPDIFAILDKAPTTVCGASSKE